MNENRLDVDLLFIFMCLSKTTLFLILETKKRITYFIKSCVFFRYIDTYSLMSSDDLICSIYFSPQDEILSSTGLNSLPISVNEYSTLGGT